MDEFKAFCEGLAVPVMMSILGGAAKAASQGVKSWRQFVGSLLVSGFAGMIVHLFIKDAGMSPSMSAALVGLSGYSGVVILDFLAVLAQRILERTTGYSFRDKNGNGGKAD